MRFYSKLLLCTLLFVINFASAEAAERALNQDASRPEICMQNFYMYKKTECLDAIVSMMELHGIKDEAGAINPATVGFFAGVFSAMPEIKSRLLTGASSSKIAPLYILGLNKAGLSQDAQAYAANNNQADFFDKAIKKDSTLLADIKPISNPMDNDFLIGAYMATGDKEHIKKILGNFSTASDQMVGDALRLSMVQARFGTAFSPPGRDSQIVKNACARYECKKDRNTFMRVLTMSSAFWALNSLGQKDSGIKEVSKNFFENDQRLKKIMIGESVAFSNYMVSLALNAAIKDNASNNKALSDYEELVPVEKLKLPTMDKQPRP